MTRPSPWRWVFMALAVVLLAASVIAPLVVVADDPTDGPCANPRSAADSLFVAGRPELTCIDTKASEKARRGQQLRQILNARGLYVPVATLSEDPDFTPENGTDRIQLLPVQAPWLVLQKQKDGRWLYSSATMNQVPDLYAATFSSVSLWMQSMLPDMFQQQVPWVGGFGWQYVFGGILLVLAVIAGLVVRLAVLQWLGRAARKLGLSIEQALLRRLDNPVMILVIGGVIAWRLPDLQLGIETSRTAYLLLSIVLGIAGILAASRIVDVLAGFWEAKTAETDSRLDDQLVPLVRQISRVVVWAIGILFVLQNNGVQVWSFVAGLGIGSLAFALAAQDTIANLFGALNIFLDKPFQIGDWVKVGSVEGTIEEVGFRSFRIRTFYNSVVTIPNSTITTTNVDNMGLRHRRRVKTTLGLTYDTPPEKIQAFVEGVRAVLAAHPNVQNSYEVHFYDFSGSSLDVLVYYHVVVDSFTQELETRASNFLEFLRVAEAIGVSFAFPSTSVYVESTPDKPLQPHAPVTLDELEARAARFGPGGDASRPGGIPFSRTWAASAVNERGGE